jgi:transposase
MTKKLNTDELEEVKRLLQAGDTPQAIANIFNLGVSSIYNYRNIFREQGAEFPNVKGKRPRKIQKYELEISNINLHEFLEKVTVSGQEYYQLVIGTTQFIIPCEYEKVEIRDGKLIVQ